MAEPEHESEQPSWVFSWEQREDGHTVFRDEQGETLLALAVTRQELGQLQAGLQGLPQDDAVLALADRLRGLEADFDRG